MSAFFRRKESGLSEGEYDQIELEGAPQEQLPLPNTLFDVLKDARLKTLFRQYLKDRFAVETLLFFEHIQMYEHVTNDAWRQRAALNLLCKFILPGAQYPVNISGTELERLKAIETFEKDSFSNAKAECFALMESNFFGPFVLQLFNAEREATNNNRVNDLEIYTKATDMLARRHRTQYTNISKSSKSTNTNSQRLSTASEHSVMSTDTDDVLDE